MKRKTFSCPYVFAVLPLARVREPARIRGDQGLKFLGILLRCHVGRPGVLVEQLLQPGDDAGQGGKAEAGGTQGGSGVATGDLPRGSGEVRGNLPHLLAKLAANARVLAGEFAESLRQRRSFLAQALLLLCDGRRDIGLVLPPLPGVCCCIWR